MNFKLLTTIVLASLAGIWVQGQTASLHGRVKAMPEQRGLPGAHVVLEEVRQVVITDYNGNFQIRNLEAGSYTVTVSFVGYNSVSRSINIDAGERHDLEFFLEEASYLADEAVVTATGVEIARRNVASAVSVVNRQALDESKESAVLTAINEQVPGLFVSERGVTGFGVAGGSAGNIRIRGVGGNPNTGVLVLIDGSPQYMGLFGHPIPDAYVTSDAERVEVIRGPASLMHGSNAMAGAINIITRKQKKDGFGGNARLSYGSYNTMKAMANAGFKKKAFEVFGSVNHDYTDGHRDNSSFRITNGYLKTSVNTGRHFKLTLDGSIAAFRTYDPGPATNPDSSYLTEEHWVDIRRTMFSLSLDNTFSKAEGSFKAFYNSGEHDIYDGFHSLDHNFGFSLYETLIPFEGNSLSAGFDFKNYGGLAENTKAMMGQGMVFADTSLYELGGYLLLRQEFFKKLILTAGLRLHYQNISGNEWVPQFGLNYLLNANHVVKLTASKGFRNPTILELFMWQTANPGLLPERMWNYEAGYIGNIPSARISLEAAVYYQQGSNMIQTIGQFPAVRYENTGEFSHYGLEFAGTWEALSFLTLEANYSWLHTDDPITGAPGHQLFTAARFHRDRFAFRLSGMYIDGLYTSINPEDIQSYFLLNARVSYQLFSFMNVWLSGDNLLDRQYEINYDYPMPGISVFGGIDIKFNTAE
jgi:iron complex outermembrane receptor protein